MAEEDENWPFTRIAHVQYTRPKDWVRKEWNTSDGPPTWIHKSGLVLAVRGSRDGSARVTLSPPYDDPRDMVELDGKYMEGDDIEGWTRRQIEKYD